jgi:tripeptide aminopeptidase
MRKLTLILAALICLTPLCAAQTAKEILAEPRVQAAMQAIQANEPHFIEEEIRLTEIPAPPFHEKARGLELQRLFTAAGLQHVRIDEAGNVLGDRPGAQPHPHLVIAAHLDTVFPEGTDVHVKRNGNVLTAPGIADDGRGLAAMLALIAAMQQAKLATRGTVTFVADVGEEGLGDSRGTKALFASTLKDPIDEFLSIDGDNRNRIVNTGVGSFRYRVTFTGPGGHSYGAFGLANPIHALGRAVDHISEIEVPAKPKTTYNVGRIGGGTSVNSIPF